MSDIIISAAKKASDRKMQERQRVTPPNIPRGQRVGSNIIEDESEYTAQQLSDIIREKGKRDNLPENSNVEREKTYNRPLGQATHRYPTRNVIQQVHRNPIEETIAAQASGPSTKKERRTQCVSCRCT